MVMMSFILTWWLINECENLNLYKEVDCIGQIREKKRDFNFFEQFQSVWDLDGATRMFPICKDSRLFSSISVHQVSFYRQVKANPLFYFTLQGLRITLISKFPKVCLDIDTLWANNMSASFPKNTTDLVYAWHTFCCYCCCCCSRNCISSNLLEGHHFLFLKC